MEVSNAPAAGAPVGVNPSDIATNVEQQREPQADEFWDPDEEYQSKKIKRIVNGKEVVRPLKEWLERSHYGEKATQTMQEAAQIRKEAEQWRKQHDTYLEQQRRIFDAIKSDPDNLFELGKQLGHNIEEIMFKRVMDEIKYRTATEEERAQIDRMREYDRMKADLAKAKQSETDYKRQQFNQRFNQSIIEQSQAYAAEHPDFLQDADWQADAVEEMIRSRSGRGQPLSLAQAAESVRQKYERLASKRADSLLQERIKSGNIPEDLRKQLAAQQIEQAKAAKRQNFAQPAKQNQGGQKQAPSVDDFFNSLKSR